MLIGGNQRSVKAIRLLFSQFNNLKLLYRVRGALSLGVKWPGREADHSPPSNAEVKE
jgi:hypothetical protein